MSTPANTSDRGIPRIPRRARAPAPHHADDAYWPHDAAGAGHRPDTLTVHFTCDDRLASARMPPMMLLPLLERALARCGEHVRAGIDVAVRRDGMRLVICVRLSSAARFRDDDAVGAIRERLSALYGSAASLTSVQPVADTIVLRLDFPLESVPVPGIAAAEA